MNKYVSSYVLAFAFSAVPIGLGWLFGLSFEQAVLAFVFSMTINRMAQEVR